jgi:hypothetical protein
MNWGIRPSSLGGWLKHLGISDKEFERMEMRRILAEQRKRRARRARRVAGRNDG